MGGVTWCDCGVWDRWATQLVGGPCACEAASIGVLGSSQCNVRSLWVCESRSGCLAILEGYDSNMCLFSDVLEASPAAQALYRRIQLSGEPLDVHREWAMLRATGSLSPGRCSRHWHIVR